MALTQSQISAFDVVSTDSTTAVAQRSHHSHSSSNSSGWKIGKFGSRSFRIDKLRRNLKASSNKFQQRVKATWTALSQQWSLTASLTFLTTIIIGAFGLRYAYVQQQLAYQAVQLAEWTARKDFLELCGEIQTLNATSVPACQRVLSEPFPAPPSLEFSPFSRQRKRRIAKYTRISERNTETRNDVFNALTADDPRSFALVVMLALLILAVFLRTCRPICPSIRTLWQILKGSRPRPLLPDIRPLDTQHISTAAAWQQLHSLSTSTQLGESTLLRHRVNKDPHISKIGIQDGAKEEDFGIAFRQFSAERGNLDEMSAEGTPLMVAALNGKRNILKMLLSKCASVNLMGGPHDTALHAAISRGFPCCVQDLLEHGANVNIHGAYSGSPLYLAAVKGHEGIVGILLDFGADPATARGHAGSAIQGAALHGHLGCIKLLLEAGGDIDCSDRIGLNVALSNGSDHVVEFFLEHFLRLSNE